MTLINVIFLALPRAPFRASRDSELEFQIFTHYIFGNNVKTLAGEGQDLGQQGVVWAR